MDGYFVLLIITIVSVQTKKLCGGNDDSRWVNGKCIKCEKCPLGEGRNFTSETEVPTNNNLCRPCNTCPQGTFDVSFNNECQACDFLKCHRSHRNVRVECGKLQDVQCGSCISGFYDEYESIDFPCSPKVSNEETQPRKKDIHETPESEPLHLHNSTNELQTLAHKNDFGLIFIIFAILPVLVSVSVIVVLYIRREQHRKKLAGVLSTVAVNQRLLNDTETDGPSQPRGEIAIQTYIRDPHPELTTRGDAPSEPRGLGHEGQAIPEAVAKGQVCKCNLSLKTTCDTCNEYKGCFRKVRIRKGDDIVSIISKNVCHKPTYLFHSLKVPDPDHYQIDNDRQRNVENMSESECIQQILNRWLEKEKEVDMLRVSRALCDNHFHHINTKLKQYLDNKAIRENLSDEDTHSIASMV